MNKEYWEIYYSKHREPNKPSSFALFCVNYVKAGCTLIELGCGNGRDSIFFSREVDLSVIAVDQCQEELSFLEKNYKMENLTFRFDDFTRLKKETYKLDYVYSRFTLHAIEEVEEDRPRHEARAVSQPLAWTQVGRTMYLWTDRPATPTEPTECNPQGGRFTARTRHANHL